MSILLICGSPRKGNTEYVLRQIQAQYGGELVLLRELNIQHCAGKQSCAKTRKCIIQDDMQALYPKLEAADIIVLGSPNYFESVSGLMKDFIDRTNVLVERGSLQGKRLMPVVVGAMATKFQEQVTKNCFECFARAHKLKLKPGLYFQATEADELLKAKIKPPKPL